MEIKYIETEKLIPYSKNAKKHNQVQINNVAESIKQFGMVQPIVIDRNNVVVIGHCRLLACKQLKMDKIPCVLVDNLTQEQVDKLRLLDNKLNESEWDFDFLSEELAELDLSDFDIDFIEKTREVNKEINEKPEIEFTEIMNEENNYIILLFKTDIDWLQAQTFFNLKQVKAYSTRKDGKINKNMERVGIGRVLDGAKVINMIIDKNKEDLIR